MNIKSKKYLFLSIFLGLIFSSLALLFLTGTAFMYFDRKFRLANYKIQGKVILEMQKELIQSDIAAVFSDLRLLTNLSSFQNYLGNPDSPSLRKWASEDWLLFAAQKKNYDQIRLLDAQGNETIRINTSHSRPYQVEKGELQNKSNRYYFKETSLLQEGEFYVSSLDLNIENGMIQKPYNPVIRFAAPIREAGEELQSIVVLNYKGDRLIQILDITDQEFQGHISLLNSQGFWMRNQDPSLEWGFLFGKEGEKNRAGILLPQHWEGISQHGFYQEYKDNLLLTSVRIPLFPEHRVTTPEDYWFLVLSENDKEMRISITGYIRRFRFVILIWIPLILFFSFKMAQFLTERSFYRQQIQYAATYDELTGLPNRHLIKDRMAEQLKYSRRYKTSFAVLYLDLDGFKQVNDTLGHDYGDYVLQEAARRFKTSLRDSDSAGRLGGDEFIVILSQIQKKEDCILVAESILQQIGRPFHYPKYDKKASIGVSIGISIIKPEDHEDMESLFKKSDSAMYQVKMSGKMGYAFSD